MKKLLIILCIAFMGNASNITAQAEQTSRGPLLIATVEATNTCNSGNSCSSWIYSTTKVNAIKITNTTYSLYQNLQVTVYNCDDPYTNPPCKAAPIATFACNKQVITYASTKLTNGSIFYVGLTGGNGGAGAGYKFTNGSFNGQKCTGTPVGGATDRQ
jgi:putative salt-induced outer membrane protein YdiY